MSLESVFAKAEAAHRAVVYRETWGHLDTKPDGVAHPGFILFALGCHGDIVVLEWEFEGVVSNPWIYQEIHEHVGKQIDKTDRAWGVWVFEGAYKVFKNGNSKFSGKVRSCRVSTRFGKKRSW